MNAAISPSASPAPEEFLTVIERVTFHDDDSGFCVLRVNQWLEFVAQQKDLTELERMFRL